MIIKSQSSTIAPVSYGRKFTNRLTGWLMATIAMTGLIAGTSDLVIAQKFKGETIESKYDPYFEVGKSRENKKKRDAILKTRKKIDDRVKKAIQDGALTSNNEKWIRDVRMNEMASNNAVVLENLRKNRTFILSLVSSSRGSTRSKLINLIIDKSEKIATDNYLPAARINAIRLMASLTEQNGSPQNKRPPRYSGKALRKVLEIGNDPTSPMFLKAACLNGLADVAFIDGQVRRGDRVPGDVRDGIVKFAMKTLSDQGENLAGGTVSGYLARRSVQVLGLLDLVTAGYKDVATVKTALKKVADDPGANVWTRFDALKGLAKLGLEKDGLQDFARSVGKLVVLVSKQEAGYVQTTLEKLKLQEEIKSSVPQAKADGGVGSGTRGGRRTTGGNSKGAGPAGAPGGGSDGSAEDATAEVYQDVMLPFHLRRVRTNVKTAVKAAQDILGTSSKAASGLSVDYKSDPQLKTLIEEIAIPMDRLVDATDLGLDVRRKRSNDEEDLNEKELAMKQEHLFKRVPFQIGKAVKDLEDVVGAVKVPMMKKK